jgi:hypothetical protein
MFGLGGQQGTPQDDLLKYMSAPGGVDYPVDYPEDIMSGGLPAGGSYPAASSVVSPFISITRSYPQLLMGGGGAQHMSAGMTQPGTAGLPDISFSNAPEYSAAAFVAAHLLGGGGSSYGLPTSYGLPQQQSLPDHSQA